MGCGLGFVPCDRYRFVCPFDFLLQGQGVFVYRIEIGFDGMFIAWWFSNPSAFLGDTEYGCALLKRLNGGVVFGCGEELYFGRGGRGRLGGGPGQGGS